MLPAWPQNDLEALETVSQNEEALEVFLRMARISGAGEMNRFLFELSENDDIDPETKAAFAEVAEDTAFLRALDEYVWRTRHAH